MLQIKLVKGVGVQEMDVVILNRVVLESLADKMTYETYYFNCVQGRRVVTVLKTQLSNYFVLRSPL